MAFMTTAWRQTVFAGLRVVLPVGLLLLSAGCAGTHMADDKMMMKQKSMPKDEGKMMKDTMKEDKMKEDKGMMQKKQ